MFETIEIEHPDLLGKNGTTKIFTETFYKLIVENTFTQFFGQSQFEQRLKPFE